MATRDRYGEPIGERDDAVEREVARLLRRGHAPSVAAELARARLQAAAR